MTKRLKFTKRHYVVLALAMVIIAGIVLGFTLYDLYRTKPLLGVWWWNDNLDDSYLNFAIKNDVTEIYYCSSRFDDTTDAFINQANRHGIKVYWLAGDVSYIDTPAKLHTKMQKYLAYQNNYTHHFAGVHLDIEPHQNANFKTSAGRASLIQAFVSLVYEMRNTYPNIWLEYDLPFWLHDETTINTITKPAYAHVIDQSDRVTLMSYRDTAAAIYNCGIEELTYVQSINKPINFGVETRSDEGNHVSFQEEGAAVMLREIATLRKMLPANCGVVIHHLQSWREMVFY